MDKEFDVKSAENEKEINKKSALNKLDEMIGLETVKKKLFERFAVAKRKNES